MRSARRSTAGASSTSFVTRAAQRRAEWIATTPPRLDPIRTTGPEPASSSAWPTWSIMRVIVSARKSGSLKSGVRSVMPCSRSLAAKNAALDDRPTRQSRAGRRPPSDQRLAAGPASAGNGPDAVRAVVVAQLLSLADVPGRADPDRVADHLGVAVRRAGMIDIARDVAADRRIADVQPIQLETPDVALLQVPDLALQALLVRNLLAVVGDDARVLVNGLGGEDAPALNSWNDVFRS